jgi:DNA-binding transcriptional regulator YbjK
MQKRRPEILQKCYDLVGTKGLESLHARTAATEMGMNHATIHYYFPKRIDLLMGVAGFAREQFAADRAKFMSGLASADALEGELALAEAYCKKQSRFAKVVLSLYAASVEHPELQKQVAGLYSDWVTALVAAVGSAKVKKGSVYKDGELLAATLFGFMAVSQLTGQKFDATGKIDAVFESLFG